MTSKQIELAVAQYFGAKGMQNRNIIVPNFKGFWNDYEMDMFIATPARYCYEVEIKTTVADLKADFKKRHFHDSDKIKYFYYAIPDEIYYSTYIPGMFEKAGLFSIKNGKACLMVKPEPLNNYKLAETEYLHLGRLLTHRLWKLKRDIKEKL